MSQCVDLIYLAGGLSQAIDELMEFSRSIWHLGFGLRKATRRGIYFSITPQEFRAWQQQFIGSSTGERAEIRKGIFEYLESLGDTTKSRWIRYGKDDGNTEVIVEAFLPLKLVELCLNGRAAGRPSDRLYFMWRNIRRKYQYDRTAEVVHAFNLLANAINVQFSGFFVREEGQGSNDGSAPEPRMPGRGPMRDIEYTSELNLPLLRVLREDRGGPKDPERHCTSFLECCRMVGYISPHFGTGIIRIQPDRIDAEFLLSKLFGLPTEMPGFDHLFGGGGIALTETVQPGSSEVQAGRVVLVRGRFGTGKSTLALSLAAEVARKEGIAWVMPLEQNTSDCKDYLESMGALPTVGELAPVEQILAVSEVLTATTTQEATDHTVARTHGSLVLLQARKGKVAQVFADLLSKARATGKFALRLLVLDPINSLFGWPSSEPARTRAIVMQMVDQIKRTGANLLLVVENDESPENPVRFIENISDTVIDLSTDRRHGYRQRYIEILKSRLQRDQRGEHPFSIKAGEGVTVFPSSAAVFARLRGRRFKRIPGRNRFGWQPLDEILGENAFFPGDVIVLRGQEGTFKTHIGLLFLLGADTSAPEGKSRPGCRRCSLMVPVRDNAATIRALLDAAFVKAYRSASQKYKSNNEIRVVEVPGGYVQPGAVYQILEREFERAQAMGEVIDRVMIDNVSHWEISCPFIREDETFGDLLTEFLRRQQVTTVLACNPEQRHRDSVLQLSLSGNADVLIDFQRIEFRGTQKVVLRAIKTRGMEHKPEAVDVILRTDGLHLGPGSKLLRVGASGEVGAVDTQLYLHEENAIQNAYNSNIVDSLKPVLSRMVALNSKDRTHLVRAVTLSPYSTVDELQILQLDEFQLPDLTTSPSGSFLHVFQKAEWGAVRWDAISPRLRGRTLRQDGTFAAVPYYENLGLLAFRSDLCKEAEVADWAELAALCQAWETTGPGRDNPGSAFFWFGTNIDENYNCLFFEMLLSLDSAPAALASQGLKGDGDCGIIRWLAGSNVERACLLMWRLCRRIHMLTCPERPRSQDGLTGEQQAALAEAGKRRDEIGRSASVWRHWFTSLSQMLHDMPLDTQRLVKIRTLPGNKSVAGEWYLGIPAYSAAPDVGLEVLRILTTREEELERFRRGVGLPTREAFYLPEAQDQHAARIHGLSASSIGSLLDKSFRRSWFDCYGKVSRIISFHLQTIIELDSPDARAGKAVPLKEQEACVKLGISEQLQSLRKNIAFVLRERAGFRCHRCQ
ncbi:MAG: ATPase domain-containing protein [Limisphaerales bacterium]